MEKTLLEVTIETWLHRLLETTFGNTPLTVEHVGVWPDDSSKASTNGSAGVWLTTPGYTIGITIEPKQHIDKGE